MTEENTVKQQQKQDQPSTMAIVAMSVSIGSFLLCTPVGIVGLILSLNERKAIREGRSPKAGETFAVIGMIVGIIDTVLTVLIILGVIVAIIIPIIIGAGARTGSF